MEWISLHIFIDTNWQTILKKCIKPLVDDLVSSKKISMYFYVLYSERGPHIRLRVKSLVDSSLIISYAAEKIQKYFADNPSTISPNRPSEYYPADSIQIIDYTPEYERYCGTHGVAISEKQFYNSSHIILNHIYDNELMSNASKLCMAIKLHLCTAWVYSHQNIEECILFFNYIYSSRTFSRTKPYIKFDPNVEIHYSQYFNNQKETIVPYVKSVLQGLKSNYEIDEEVNEWIKLENEIKEELEVALGKRKIEIPMFFESYPVWYLLESYIHMMNNRLGVANVDEALIAYFIMQSLKEN